MAAAGLPVSCPVRELNELHAGLPEMAKVRVPPAGLDALGRNVYWLPVTAWVDGVPEMISVAAEETVIAKAGSDADSDPSLTLIMMPVEVPTLAAAGVPLRLPVPLLNVAHEGLPLIEKVNVPPPGLDAVGLNVYAVPAVTLVGGVPEMAGGGGGVDDFTVIANGGKAADAEPLLTLITIPGVVPTLAIVGVPLRVPVPVLNFPHAGRLATEKTIAPAPEGSEALGWNT